MMSNDIKQWRKTRRAELLARRVAVPLELRRQWNLAITQYLLKAFPIFAGMTVGCYWPMKGEVDPRFAMRQLRKQGAVTALAVVTARNAPLQFLEWRPGIPLRPGLFDLPVPQGSRQVVPQVLLIPPVGFGPHGYRLGYGGGYYDRTLAALQPQPLKIGLAFEISRIETIRPQPHDIPLDFVITEAGIFHSRPVLEAVREPREAADYAVHLLCERGIAPGSPAVRRGEYSSPTCDAPDVDPYYWM